MRILIVGASGLLGSRLALNLAQQGHQVRLGSRNPDSMRSMRGHEVITLRWDKPQSLQMACREMDVVLHAAGMNAADCAADPVGALQINGVATARLAVAAASAGVGCLMYFSTAHVYASPLQGRVSEQDRPGNLHPYASSHLAGEFAVLQTAGSNGLKSVVLRLSNAFGAPGNPEALCWSLLAHDVCRQLAQTGRIRLQSSGAQWRDFIPLASVCDVVQRLLVMQDQLGIAQLFNLGGVSMRVIELVQRIQARYLALTGLHATLECGEPETKVVNPLDFRSERLIGVVGAIGLDIDGEIDALLQYCFDHFALRN